MSVRFLVSNGVKLLLVLLPIVLGASDTVKALSLGALVLVLFVDVLFYRRDKAAFDEEDDTRIEPVPLPPSRSQRSER